MNLPIAELFFLGNREITKKGEKYFQSLWKTINHHMMVDDISSFLIRELFHSFLKFIHVIFRINFDLLNLGIPWNSFVIHIN